MKSRFSVALIGLLLSPVVAFAQSPMPARDAGPAVGTTVQPPAAFTDLNADWKSMADATGLLTRSLEHTQKSLQAFVQETLEMKTELAATADYWRDACQSTPQCGGQKQP